MAFDPSQYNLSKDPLSGAGTYGEGGIVDANQRLQQLQQALQSGQIDYSTYQGLFNQLNPGAQQDIKTYFTQHFAKF